MELLTEDGAIAKRILEIKPQRIAVAYLGAAWRDYVDIDSLESVVLSPTIGSNPEAIDTLVAAITWEKVHFLDHLHAKFYLSSTGAVLGSSNLSSNGLQGSKGLVESAVFLDSVQHPDAHEDLTAMHRRIEAMAKYKYKTIAAKEARLSKLKKDVARLNWANGKPIHRPSKNAAQGTPLSAFTYDAERHPRIHIIGWYDELEQKKSKVSEALTAYPGRMEYALDHYVAVRLNDNIQVSDWVLLWKTDVTGHKPARNGSIEWMQVDFILIDSAKSKTWRRVCYEGYPREPHQVPFVLDDAAKRAFRKLIRQDTFTPLLAASITRGWSLQNADKMVAPFLESIQKEAN